MNKKYIKGVYCLTSPSGKRYVGIGMSRLGIDNRWSKYRHLKCKKQPKLYNALKKYGPENFKYEVILETDDVERAKRVEQQLIALWNLQNGKYGYNISVGGDSGSFGIKQSEESNIKRSIKLMGRQTSELQKKRASETNKGKIVSEETRKKVSETMKTLFREGKLDKPKGSLGIPSVNRKYITVESKVTGERFHNFVSFFRYVMKINTNGLINKGYTKEYILIKE